MIEIAKKDISERNLIVPNEDYCEIIQIKDKSIY